MTKQLFLITTTFIVGLLVAFGAVGFGLIEINLPNQIGDTVQAQEVPSAMQDAAQPSTDAAPLTGSLAGSSAGSSAAPASFVVEASVLPAQSADLSMSTSGLVQQIMVAEGQTVEAGELLIQLDAADQKVDVSQAEADLARQQANLDQLLAGARPEDIAAAQATVDAATARLMSLQDSTDAGDIANAEAALLRAKADLQNVLNGAADEQIIAARADLQNAEAERRRAQNAYNDVKWRNDIGALPQAADLEKATNSFEAAQATLADLEGGPTQAEISSASANVQQAEADLNSLLAKRPADIAALQAELRNAQAQLDSLLNGTRPEEIAAAEADVASATATLQKRLVALKKTELVAPFSGTVASIDVNIGEEVVKGSPIIRLADQSQWHIETDDLSELQVVFVQDGDGVNIAFDAFPDLVLSGNVQHIQPFGEDSFGDIVYQAVVLPETHDERLRWNMTAAVTFNADTNGEGR